MSEYRLYRVMRDLEGKHCGNKYLGNLVTCGKERVMDRREAKKWFAQMRPQFKDDTEIAEALDLAIKALSDPHNCAGCKYEEMWSAKCEKCSRPLTDEYEREE